MLTKIGDDWIGRGTKLRVQDGKLKNNKRSDGLTRSIRWKRNKERYDEETGNTIEASGNR
jgi:hypothetical protein